MNRKKKEEKLTLPVLITRSLVVFPNVSPYSIDVARDFSIKAVDSSKKNFDSLILVLSQKKPTVDKPTKNDVYDVASLCHITDFIDQKKFYRIKIECTRRVKVIDIQFNNGMYIANVSPIDDVLGNKKEEVVLIRDILKEIQNSIELKNNISPQLISTLSKPIDAALFANFLADKLHMSVDKRQDLLSTVNVNEKLLKIFKIIKEEKEIEVIDKKIQDSVRNSIDKNQKDYILREKIKQIRKELGDDDDSDILEKLEKNPYPEHIKKKIKEEYKKLEIANQSSLEGGVIKQYINTVMDLPWFQQTNDNDDLINAKRILDENHFGLKQVKERIIEYLAVKKMTKSLKAPILCFFGPPGVGKTSLAKSIAKALGRKFAKISLGGVSDEAEIRGHRKTYVGAMPGRIIDAINRCGFNNPVILLDEIDKISSFNGIKGDPTNALLEVLDPEQNKFFRDNYIEESFDLSNVLFIATANNVDKIYKPLLDRMETIELNSYIEQEKINIAKNFLIKKQLEINGLKDNNITISDDAIKLIINNYTLESGVRELERQINKIIRKLMVDYLNNNKLIDKKKISKVIKLNEIKNYLGVEKYFINKNKDSNGKVGIVMGLAYTSYGGATLPIEVNYFPGKGKLILTGSLGNVMKESAMIALNYVKSNTKKYNIDSNLFKDNDIHIHFPEGAIPKDGPSAGIAITLAIISRFSNIPVRSDVAMTGEINLCGSALPIGGLREKTSAALRYGIANVMVPYENQRAIDELPKEIKSGLNIIFMNSIDDTVKFALKK